MATKMTTTLHNVIIMIYYYTVSAAADHATEFCLYTLYIVITITIIIIFAVCRYLAISKHEYF